MAFDAETLRVGGRDKTEATGPQPPLSSERNPVAATSPTNELPHREDGAFRNFYGKSPPGTSLRLPALNGLHRLSLAWPQRPARRQLRLCAANTIFPGGWVSIGKWSPAGNTASVPRTTVQETDGAACEREKRKLESQRP